MKCPFCNYQVDSFPAEKHMNCPRCGIANLSDTAYEDFDGENFSNNDKAIFSIVFRNEYERRGKKGGTKVVTLGDLHRILEQYHPPTPIEKLNDALLKIYKSTNYVGQRTYLKLNWDYPHFHCLNETELINLLQYLEEDDLIKNLGKDTKPKLPVINP